MPILLDFFLFPVPTKHLQHLLMSKAKILPSVEINYYPPVEKTHCPTHIPRVDHCFFFFVHRGIRWTREGFLCLMPTFLIFCLNCGLSGCYVFALHLLTLSS